MPPEKLSLRDYLRAQEVLIEQEKHLAEIAQQVASGRLPISELDQASVVVEAQRELVKAVLQKVLDDLRP